MVTINDKLRALELEARRAAEPDPNQVTERDIQRALAKKQQREDAALRALVNPAQVAIEAGERAFYFPTRKDKLRRWDLAEAQAQLLESGALAIVERPDPDKIEHVLVPAEVARAVHARWPRAVRFWNGAAVEDAAGVSLKHMPVETAAEASAGSSVSEPTLISIKRTADRVSTAPSDNLTSE